MTGVSACLTSLLKENDSLKNQVKKLEEEKFHMSSSIRVLREDLETERSLTSDLEAQLKLASQASKDIEVHSYIGSAKYLVLI